ncbi:poly(ADP-ribose) glycohydrolase 1-like isoform X2 [Curcuma longa]|uniref:poly(ADP-ribose) glycohydrolase 1-like isoform X2 n=1 Tax=Curcuma longa TaxID=136217 RepID=UPI003D9E0490
MGDYQDNKPFDSMGRRKTWIVAIDALCNPRMRQYEIEYLVRETIKALCGFFDQSKYKCRIEDVGSSESKKCNAEGTSVGESSSVRDFQGSIGIATGNWGCGAFGGDLEVKSMIQWLAASEGLRPFIHYYSFGVAAMQKLEEVTRWILQHGWTVSDLWSMLAEYCNQRLSSKTFNGFFDWLLPNN